LSEVKRDASSRLKKPSGFLRRGLTRRTIPILLGVVVMALIGVALWTDQGEPPAQAQPVPPGIQPAVQKWMKDREKPQIELNNALIPIVQKEIEQPGASESRCRRLAAAVKVLLNIPAAPDPNVDELARAGLVKIEQGAAACLAGDLATAERLVAEGLAERTAAQEPLDETLEGE